MAVTATVDARLRDLEAALDATLGRAANAEAKVRELEARIDWMRAELEQCAGVYWRSGYTSTASNLRQIAAGPPAEDGPT